MISGSLLILLALWGGLIPFIGPYFDFGFGSSEAWVYNADRLVLSILPAIAVGLGGLILLIAANRPVAMLGGWMAILGGLWFVVGTTIAELWNVNIGTALGGVGRQVAERLSFFEGLGAIMVLLGALALGRFLVVGVREARRAEAGRAAAGRAGAADRPAAAGRPGAGDRTDADTEAGPGWERAPEREKGHKPFSRSHGRHATSGSKERPPER